MFKTLSWYLMTLSAIAVASYAFLLLSMPGLRSGFVQDIFINMPSIIAIHLAGGIFAIVSGAFLLKRSLLERFLTMHRLIGRCYVIAIGFSGLAGLILAINSVSGNTVRMGFSLLAIAWIVTTFNAFFMAIKGNIAVHKKWMQRSYSLTLAGVTLRLYLGITTALGIPFTDTYPILSWLCWVPNLLIIEWYIQGKAQSGNALTV